MRQRLPSLPYSTNPSAVYRGVQLQPFLPWQEWRGRETHFTPSTMGSPVVPGRRCLKLLLPWGAGGKAEPNSCCTPVGDLHAGAVVIPEHNLMYSGLLFLPSQDILWGCSLRLLAKWLIKAAWVRSRSCTAGRGHLSLVTPLLVHLLPPLGSRMLNGYRRKTGCVYLGVFLVRAWVCLFCFGAFCFVFQIKQEVVLEFKDPRSAMSMIALWSFYFRWLRKGSLLVTNSWCTSAGPIHGVWHATLQQS